MSVRDTLTELLTLEAHLAALEARKSVLRADLERQALDRLDEDGAAPTWKAPGLGSATLAMPKARPRISNEAALVDYVRDIAPTEVIETVRSTFVTVLTSRCKELGDGTLVDEDGTPVPGVTMTTKAPYLSVRLDPDAKAAAIDAALIADQTTDYTPPPTTPEDL